MAEQAIQECIHHLQSLILRKQEEIAQGAIPDLNDLDDTAIILCENLSKLPKGPESPFLTELTELLNRISDLAQSLKEQQDIITATLQETLAQKNATQAYFNTLNQK